MSKPTVQSLPYGLYKSEYYLAKAGLVLSCCLQFLEAVECMNLHIHSWFILSW